MEVSACEMEYAEKVFDQMDDLENRIVKDKNKKLYTISDECIEKIIKRKHERELKNK